ncbi:MAG: FliA/WhiG family RNA polymerase sigma factor [Thermodesulfobacteriota bacterium]|nr:FliA/WhiG family RNA polymerase sigma factor [Thermodesulfobacteriota bacterium]
MGLAERQTRDPEGGNQLSRDQLIAEYLPYVKRIVHRIAVRLPYNVVEIDDLMNAGIIGLIAAIERYDPARGNKFMTYAVFRIKGAILSELRSQDFLSRSTRRKLRELENTHLRMEQALGREVKDEEVANELGLSLDEIYKIKQMSAISFISFDEIGYSLKEEKDAVINYLVNGDTKDGLALTRVKEVEAAIARSIEKLSEKEKLVISLYYWDELTMKEIGKVLNITESRVSQIHSQAVIHLRGKLKKEGYVMD